MPDDKSKWQKARTAPRDLIAIVFVTILYFALASYFELSEKIAVWARTHETWQFDELPLTLLLLAIGLGWFGWRRLGESRAEAHARALAEQAGAHLLQQNRLLAQQLISVQEQERKSIAREIHDELGQCCNAIKIDAASIEKHIRSGTPPAHTSALAIIGTANHIHEIVRSMLQRLRPSTLDDLGLSACLQELVETWAQRHHIVCDFMPEGKLDKLGEALNITIYRIVQECLTNIARHSGAAHATICIKHEDEVIHMVIEDNGCGMREKTPSGFGLVGMTERVNALGGTLAAYNLADKGMRVDVILPVGAPA